MKNECVLIPSYNEAAAIGRIVNRLKERGFTVYVIDDGSEDATAAIAERSGALVIRHERNMGKGAALRIGFKKALDDGFELIIIMDGDDQHDVTDIARLLMKMHHTHAGMVIGNRMADTSAMPLVRILVNKFMSSIISAVSGQNVPDTQCGFRLIRRGLLEKVNLESSNYEIESEMIIEAARNGFKIESAPIKTIYRNESSRINPFIDTLRFIRFIIKMMRKRRDF